MRRIVLCRHADPEADARGRCYGSLDVGLSPEGRARAEQLARQLASLEVDAVYASPRRRALATAEPVAAAAALELRVHDALRELDFGELEGLLYDEIAATRPELYQAWMERPTSVAFPGGESFADLKTRALEALDAIRRTHRCAVVVTHGGVVRAALAGWLSLPDENVFVLGQDYCGVTIVDWFDDTPLIRLVNGTAHTIAL